MGPSFGDERRGVIQGIVFGAVMTRLLGSMDAFWQRGNTGSRTVQTAGRGPLAGPLPEAQNLVRVTA